MKTTTINISTKKNEIQITHWLVVQECPYPDITAACGGLKWRNADGLFSSYGRPAFGIGKNYVCHLLTPDAAPTEDYDRTIFAGYEGRPGTFKLRGADLGEVRIGFGDNPDYPDIKVRGFDYPTRAERDLISSQIVPHLRTFIAANAASLKSEAIARVAKQFARKLAEAREELVLLEKDAAKAIQNAEAMP